MCSIISTNKECLLIDSTFYVLNICKLRLYGGNNWLPFCHFVLYANILLRCHSTNAAINSLSTATSAILIGSFELENLLVNAKFYVQPCSAACKSMFLQSLLHIGLIHIWLSRTALMLLVPTSDYARCQCCNAPFQRLSSHLSWNEFCGAYYKNMPLDIGNGGVTDDMHAPGVAYFNPAGATIGTRK